ncbi:MAG: tRNA (adenosine(37)-N6)-threonylcarbamoyltransferase complex ATPase subunit type 1 TsaE [Candidatus Omnitrophota bacterium]
MCSLKIISRSEKETIDFGARLGRLLKRGDIVCLFGILGAGKTILVKGMAKGLGINKNEVISPSFVLIREYLPVKKKRAGIPLYHFDLYRLKNLREILSLGCEEYFYDRGITVIEWAERMGGYLPAEFLKVEIEIKGESQRAIKLTAKGQHYRNILKRRGHFSEQREKRP